MGLLITASLFSEAITNSKPLVGSINGRLVFPAYITYNKPKLGFSGGGVVDYKEIALDFQWALWPLFSWDPFENDLNQMPLMAPPSSQHFMGTDTSGRDVFARLLYGTRISLIFGFGTCFVTFFIGTLVGLFQGYIGGKWDLFGQRFLEIFSTIPEFYLLLFLITLFSPNLFLLIPLTSAFAWVGICQYMRGEALRNKNNLFTEASKSMGASTPHILFFHILPNSLVPLVTLAPFSIVASITTLAQLDFLGFGVPPPTASWGELLEQAHQNFQNAWWLTLFPSGLLFITTLSLNFIGQDVRLYISKDLTDSKKFESP